LGDSTMKGEVCSGTVGSEVWRIVGSEGFGIGGIV